MYAEVLVEIKAEQVNKTFTYLIPDRLKDIIKVGMRVYVPFGRQKLEGFVTNIHNNKPDYELKEIIENIDDHPVLTSEMLELGKYISKKTLTNLIVVYQAMLPAALKAHHDFVVPKKFITYVSLEDDTFVPKVGSKQEEVLKAYHSGTNIRSDLAKVSQSAVKTLIDKGIFKEYQKEVYRLDEDIKKQDSKFKLNDEQEQALDVIKNNINNFKTILLHGVTGSGKTEVYMHAISEVLKIGKEAIVLVPEISLTPQMVDTFRSRFGSDIAILHSRLSEGEKYDEWRKIERKEVHIVIGARSAIFAPFTNLGIIIIDEEHSDTYKQENNPRYQAIDVAIWRAKRYNALLILGSATPSLESYTRAKMGIYELVELKERVNRNMPKVTLVDMHKEMQKGHRVISELLDIKIRDRLSKHEQILILLNRRGYSTVVTCHDCGYTDKCPNCDIPLTYHKASNSMRCHYCEYVKPKDTICPNCKSKDINEFGMGTQKLEEIIENSYPSAHVIRMDLDTTINKNGHAKIIEAFESGEYDIMIGTQMIAKGLDFPNVTLVGVLNGDSSLNIPDFRSSERTFELLDQVAGRSGRSTKAGEVIIQGFNIDHYALKDSVNSDYLGFYKTEMEVRKTLKYPPYYNLSLIKVSGKDINIINTEAEKIAKYLKSKLAITILGPSTSSMPKVNNIYYMQIILKYRDTKEIMPVLEFVIDHYRKNNKVRIEVDMNPIRF
jgi:primosomal protein N' (replication factor Y)